MSGTGFEPNTDGIVNGNDTLGVGCMESTIDSDTPPPCPDTNMNYYTPAGSGILDGGHGKIVATTISLGETTVACCLERFRANPQPRESNSKRASTQAWLDDQIWPHGSSMVCETATKGALWSREDGIRTIFDSIGMRFPHHVPPADTLHQVLVIDEGVVADGDLAPSSLETPA